MTQYKIDSRIPNPLLDSTRSLPRGSHNGDDEEHDGFLKDARLTFDKSMFVFHYGDDDVGTPRTKFSPSNSALHAADMYVLYVLTDHQVRGRLTDGIRGWLE